MNVTDVIKGPLITEKLDKAREKFRQYSFIVDKKASKYDVANAVEKLFNVKVKAVNTHLRKGKMKTFKNIRARQSDVKRAVVTLEEGHSIDVTTGL